MNVDNETKCHSSIYEFITNRNHKYFENHIPAIKISVFQLCSQVVVRSVLNHIICGMDKAAHIQNITVPSFK